MVGHTLNFWCIESYEPSHRLRLAAEMKFPSRARLEFDVEDRGRGSAIHQTAAFDPAAWEAGGTAL